MKPRVLFVVTDMLTGGAEKQLVRLLSRLHGKAIEAAVVSLGARGPMSAEVEALAVPLHHLNLENPLLWPLALGQVRVLGRRFHPDVVQGWMYHGNLAAFWICRGCAGAALAFGIRQSLYVLAREKRLTRGIIRLNAALSRRAAAVVYNSQIARAQHEAFGFAPGQGRVIHNGFDAAAFRPDVDARRSVRAELHLPPAAPLVGLIARYHPMKGHEVFLRAAERLAARRPDVHFVLAGRGVAAGEPPFSGWAARLPLGGRLHLLGERADIPRLTAALDVASSASWAEAFPNTIGEAMNCAVPCVATDVGDVKQIVGEAGIVVAVGDDEALAAGWDKLLALGGEEKAALGAAARRRVMDKFDLDAVAEQYATLYRQVSALGRDALGVDEEGLRARHFPRARSDGKLCE